MVEILLAALAFSVIISFFISSQKPRRTLINLTQSFSLVIVGSLKKYMPEQHGRQVASDCISSNSVGYAQLEPWDYYSPWLHYIVRRLM
jgi:hypothetical protein